MLYVEKGSYINVYFYAYYVGRFPVLFGIEQHFYFGAKSLSALILCKPDHYGIKLQGRVENFKIRLSGKGLQISGAFLFNLLS
jgi:hypothetical protein